QVALAYRTCPHMDQVETGQRAAAKLHWILRHGDKPTQALAKPPMIVNIMAHDTSCAPLSAFMEKAEALEDQRGIHSVSVLPGFAYAGGPQMGPSVIAVTEDAPERARREAARLAADLWAARAQMAAWLPDAATAVRAALEATRRPVVLVDTGDNVGGGSAG